MIKQFKQYFSKLGIYNGDINNPLIDDSFVFAAKSIENKLSIQLKKLNKNIHLDNIILTGNKLNKNASPQDIEKAFILINAQSATMDTIDIKEDPPLATKFVPTADDKKLETGDYSQSQQIGLTEEILPQKLANNIDERFLLFSMIK